METIMTRLQDRWSRERLKRLNVVAAHEDFATGARVNEFCRHLTEDLGSGCEIVKQMWLLNLLRLPQLRAIAAHDASSADLIIISMHEPENFPEELKEWVEMWLQTRRKEVRVLVALFDFVGGHAPGSLQGYLAAAAKRGGMGFFLQAEGLAA